MKKKMFITALVMTFYKLFSQPESKYRGKFGADLIQCHVIILNTQFTDSLMVSFFCTCNSLSDHIPQHLIILIIE